MKKFYTLASSRKTDDGYLIQLDGKSIKTPLGQELTAPTEELAEAIVAEWAGQGETIKPDEMHLTQILNTVIDKARERDAITKALMKYLDTDLLCYRAASHLPVAARQAEIWNPWLSWFDEHFEAPLETTEELTALKQDEQTHSRVWNYIEALDEYYFTALQIVTSVSGSIVLGLAFCEDAITPDDIFNTCQLEEIHKAEIYNEEEHGTAPHQEKTQGLMKQELAALRRFLDMLE